MNNKFVYIILSVSFLGASCAKESTDPLVEGIWNEIKTEYINNYPICTAVSDGFKYSEPNWYGFLEFDMPDETVAAMSSCGLLDSYIDIPLSILGNNSIISQVAQPYRVSVFWETLKGRPIENWSQTGYFHDCIIISELFTRNDFIQIISERYVSMILDKNVSVKMERMEMLIASDIFLEKLSRRELKNFLGMALKMVEIRNKTLKCPDDLNISRFILANIMLLNNFEPFVKEFKAVKENEEKEFEAYTEGKLFEYSGGMMFQDFGYHICLTNVVEKHACQFLKTF